MRPTATSNLDPASAAALALALFDEHRRGLYGFALATVRDATQAEDLVQETFLRLVRELAAGHRPSNPSAWLFRVCANLVSSDARRRGTLGHLLVQLVPHDAVDSAEDETMRRVEWQALRRGLQALTPEARVAVLLAADGHPGREVATLIGRTESATRTILFRARRALRLSLAGETGSPGASPGRAHARRQVRRGQPNSSPRAASNASP